MLPIEYSGASRTKIAEVFHILILIPRGLVTFFIVWTLLAITTHLRRLLQLVTHGPT